VIYGFTKGEGVRFCGGLFLFLINEGFKNI